MRTLALDPATTTGFAHSNGQSGIWRIGGPDNEHAGKRLIRLEDFILDAHQAWGVERIAFEAAAYGGNYAATKQFHNGVRGVILLVAAKIGAQWAEYNPKTVKKFATNSGAASKQDMIRAVKIQFGLEVTDDNQADAIFILKLDEQSVSRPWSAPEKAKPKAIRARRKAEPKLF